LILNFAGIDNPEEAGPLRGAYITVPLSEARALPAGRYYHFQLIGLRVVDNHDHKPLGTVAEVLTYPANDVLRVTGVGRERLMPMVSSVVLEVDLDEGQITVDLGKDTEA
jgi:16S rRNA processing protein RimM